MPSVHRGCVRAPPPRNARNARRASPRRSPASTPRRPPLLSSSQILGRGLPGGLERPRPPPAAASSRTCSPTAGSGSRTGRGRSRRRHRAGSPGRARPAGSGRPCSPCRNGGGPAADYTLSDEDLQNIGARRRPRNKLASRCSLCLLRDPGPPAGSRPGGHRAASKPPALRTPPGPLASAKAVATRPAPSGAVAVHRRRDSMWPRWAASAASVESRPDPLFRGAVASERCDRLRLASSEDRWLLVAGPAARLTAMEQNTQAAVLARREEVWMETTWLHALGKHNRGSRPRCVLLVDGTGPAVAARLTALIGLASVTVSPHHFWMPCGKPVRMGDGWDDRPAAEARFDRDDQFVGPEVRRHLLDWWLSVVPGANTPNWDLVSTCRVEGKEGLLLVEAKAYRRELPEKGKPEPSTKNGWKNHEQIGSAIEQANAGLGSVTRGIWGLSRDDHYPACQSVRVVMETGNARGAGRSALSRLPERQRHDSAEWVVPYSRRLGLCIEGPRSGLRGQLLLGESTGR